MTKSPRMPAGQKQWGSANSECIKSSKQSAASTTFVETDSESFRELVQQLTGLSHDSQEGKLPVTMPARNFNKGSGESGILSGGSCGFIRSSGVEVGPRKTAFKLHERRHLHRKLEINLDPAILPGQSPDRHAIKFAANCSLSPSLPGLVPSPITPLGPQSFISPSGYNCSPSASTPVCASSCSEEKEKFDFQPSPGLRPREREPKLLPLFPLHSPREPNV